MLTASRRGRSPRNRASEKPVLQPADIGAALLRVRDKTHTHCPFPPFPFPNASSKKKSLLQESCPSLELLCLPGHSDRAVSASCGTSSTDWPNGAQGAHDTHNLGRGVTHFYLTDWGERDPVPAVQDRALRLLILLCVLVNQTAEPPDKAPKVLAQGRIHHRKRRVGERLPGCPRAGCSILLPTPRCSPRTS